MNFENTGLRGMQNMRRKIIGEKRLSNELLFEKLKTSNNKDKYKELLILNNIGLILDRMRIKNIPITDDSDFFSAGLVGLTDAIEKYDENKGSFSTIAVFYIDKEVLAQKSQENMITSKPQYFEQMLYRWRVANARGEDIDSFLIRQKERDKEKFSIPNMKKKLLAAQRELGVTTILNGSGEESEIYSNLMSDDDVEENVRRRSNVKSDKKLQEEIIKILGQRNGEIIIKREVNGRQLEAIGKEYGLSRERIRQICEKAMLKLRKHPRVCKIKEEFEIWSLV